MEVISAASLSSMAGTCFVLSFFLFLLLWVAAAQQRLMQQVVCRHGWNAKVAVVYRCCTDLADVAVYGSLLDPIYYLLHTAELP